MDINILLVLQDFRNGAGAFLAGFFSKMTWLGELNTAIKIKEDAIMNLFELAFRMTHYRNPRMWIETDGTHFTLCRNLTLWCDKPGEYPVLRNRGTGLYFYFVTMEDSIWATV